MRTSHTVLALLGLTAFGSMTTQANDQFFDGLSTYEYDNTDMQELYNRGYRQNNGYGQNQYSTKTKADLIDDMAKALEKLGKMSRTVIHNSVQLAKTHPRDLQINHSIQNLGASSNARAQELKSIQGKFSAHLMPDDKVNIAFKRMQTMMKTAQDEIYKMLQEEQFQKMKQAQDDFKQQKADLPTQHDISGVKRQAKGKQSQLSQQVSQLDHVSSQRLKSNCLGDKKIKCKDEAEKYVQHTIQSLEAAQEKIAQTVQEYNALHARVESMQEQIDGFTTLEANVKVYTATLQPITAYLKVSEKVLAESYKVSDENAYYQEYQMDQLKDNLDEARLQNFCAEKQADAFVSNKSSIPKVCAARPYPNWTNGGYIPYY